jgi:GDP-L-fucose synthase
MFYKDKTVLVTGGTGFVGSHFVDALLAKGAKIRIPLHHRSPRIKGKELDFVSADLTMPDDCLRVCEGVDYLFHAAGAVSAAGTTVTNPMSAITTNLILTARILEAACTQGVKRALVFSSGTTAYPAADYPVKEEEMFSGPPPDVYFGYGWMRRYIELISEFVSNKSEMKVAICRPTAVYGRHDDFNPLTGHVIPALIRRAVERENPFVVWGTGDEIRDFLHVRDLVRGCLLLLEIHPHTDPINIGYGKPTAIKEVVEIILKATKHDRARIEFDATKPTTIPARIVDTGKARTILGFSPQVGLEQGLSDTVAWYQNVLAQSRNAA